MRSAISPDEVLPLSVNNLRDCFRGDQRIQEDQHLTLESGSWSSPSWTHEIRKKESLNVPVVSGWMKTA